MIRCSVFDMNGVLVKSAHVTAGPVGEIWNNVNQGLREGAYVLRFSGAKSTQTARVRK